MSAAEKRKADQEAAYRRGYDDGAHARAKRVHAELDTISTAGEGFGSSYRRGFADGYTGAEVKP